LTQPVFDTYKTILFKDVQLHPELDHPPQLFFYKYLTLTGSFVSFFKIVRDIQHFLFKANLYSNIGRFYLTPAESNIYRNIRFKDIQLRTELNNRIKMIFL